MIPVKMKREQEAKQKAKTPMAAQGDQGSVWGTGESWSRVGWVEG